MDALIHATISLCEFFFKKIVISFFKIGQYAFETKPWAS